MLVLFQSSIYRYQVSSLINNMYLLPAKGLAQTEAVLDKQGWLLSSMVLKSMVKTADQVINAQHIPYLN